MKRIFFFLSIFIAFLLSLSVLMCLYPMVNDAENSEAIKDGTVDEYYDNGRLLSQTNYKDGLVNGTRTLYHENGNVFKTVNYVKGLKDGPEKTYYKNSLLKSVIPYHNSVREGEAVVYFNDNNFSSETRPVQAKVVFKDNKAVSGYCYHPKTKRKIDFNPAHLHNFEVDMSTPCDILRKEKTEKED